MCIDRYCCEGDCERCRKIDRMCGWPYGYKPIYKRSFIKTDKQKDNFNKFMLIQIKKTEQLGKNFYKGT